MSPEDEGQEYKSKSTSTSVPVILDLAMNNHNNHNNIYNSNNSYPLNKITSNSAAKAKWLNSSNAHETNNINITNDLDENDRYNSETDENRNATKQNGHHHHLTNGSIKILPKTPNGSTNNGKIYYNNNNKDIENNLNSTDNYLHQQQNNHGQLERRDSATNVLSPLLGKENHTTNTNHHNNDYNDDFDSDDNTLKNNITTNNKTNTLPLHDSLPNINSPVIYNEQREHRNNGMNGSGGGGGGGNCGGRDNVEWINDTVEKNNLKNNLHRNNHHYRHKDNLHHHHHNHHHQHNNNGSLTNGKNALGVDKLLNENDTLTDPILYKTKTTNYNDDEDVDIPDTCTCSNNKFNKISNISDYTDNNYEDDSDNKSNLSSSSCGIFGCNPKWAKNLASTHMFMVVFLLAWVCIGMFSTYFVSIITTIEKLFQIKSRTTGMLLSASELGQISTALLLTYYAGRGHRPRWIACGMVLFALAAFACSLPHFIFGSQLMQSNNLFNGDKNSLNNKNNIDLNLCLNPTYSTIIGDNLTNSIFFNSTQRNINEDECMQHLKEEQDSHSKITIIVMCIFFFSLLSAGIGQTAVSTLGIPYIDDNVASKESPIYLAITIGVRILGPATGFIVGSFCTRIYVDLSTPDFSTNDPRWISAWWLGPVLIGTIMILASIAMFSFPKELQGKRSKTNSPESSNVDINKVQEIIVEEKPKLKDFPKTLKRQLGNSILMFRTASSVFHILPIAGLYTFLPKYLETQFRLPAADANLITAFGGILVMGFGIIISGILILKINPSAKSVAAWIAFTALMYSAGIAILMFVGCNIDDFAGLSKYTIEHETSTPTFLPSCDVTCDCDFKKFSPICGVDGKTYFSSCHAGCSVANSNSNKTYYTDCKCIPNGFEKYNINGTDFEAVGGYCDTNCKNFIIFICIFAFCVFIHSTSEVGGMLVIMRCTDPKDKAMAMGVIQSAIGLFGTVPCPIIYGAVVDSACLVWTTVCGKHGACSLYDVDNFRHYFLGITSGIMFIAFIMDVVVWSKAHRIHIAPSDATDASSIETEFEKPINKPDSSV
ncbi:solute carrier organic anion transporter family member 74D [Condylostylus longicornis]|uniref:solute carrier organic anion transporter family member 74D n=1 Tax=Condylostylus longicornis TaxID=2530218 RepID=UPI00244DACDA|nr:solute carrier organic anion transporter family member 74D [Condylostylus longicornis]XP_055376194.1 solute carrier organic anion transporter family member 74D [Condylostylus longicornis]